MTMVLAPALNFILVLCCQPASASSLRQNIPNVQHKSSREDYNSLSSNRPVNPMPTTQATIVVPDGYGASCIVKYNCRWFNMVCKSKQCVCPDNYLPNFNTNNCEYVSHVTSDKTPSTTKTPQQQKPANNKEKIWLGGSLGPILVSGGIYACVTLMKWLRQFNQSSEPDSDTGVLGLTDTSNTVNLVGGQADLPPGYTDSYMRTPQEKADGQNKKLPTYDEVMEQSEWNSRPVFVITPHSSGEEPGPHGFFRAPTPGAPGAFGPTAPASPSTLRTDDQSQNPDFHVDYSVQITIRGTLD